MKAEISAALALAFDGDLSDAVRSFAGERLAPAAYDPALGTSASSAAPLLTYSGRGVFSRYNSREVDGTLVLSSDVKLLALQSEVSAAPVVGDRINGSTVVAVGEDAAAITWRLQLRASAIRHAQAGSFRRTGAGAA